MMNHTVKKFTSAALALALAVSMGTMATAASPAAGDYSISVTQNTMSFIKNGAVVGTFAMKGSDVTLKKSSSGELWVCFTDPNTGVLTPVTLGQQAIVVLNGQYNSITVDASVTSDKGFIFGGTIGTLKVNAPVGVTLSSTAKVTSLQVANSAAVVAVSAGAQVTSAGAVKTSSITGFNGTISTIQPATSAPPATKIQTTKKTTATKSSNAGKEKVYLEIYEDDDSKNTEEVNVKSNNSVELIAKSGVSLGLAMKDVVLEVTHDTDKENDRVSGRWQWVDASSTTHDSGTYTYRFYPSLSSKYPTVDVKVKFEGDGNSNSSSKSSSLSKPSISFSGKSHGPGGNVKIDVRIPSGVDDDATLYVIVDRNETEYSIDEGDAGDEDSYTAYVDPGDYEDGDRASISVKIKMGSKTVKSKTLKYTVEKDGSSSTSLGRLKISGSDKSGTDDYKVYIDVPDTDFSDGKLKLSVSGPGKIDPSGTRSVDPGDSVEVYVEIKSSADKDDTIKVSATLSTNKGSLPKVTHTYRVTRDMDDD